VGGRSEEGEGKRGKREGRGGEERRRREWRGQISRMVVSRPWQHWPSIFLQMNSSGILYFMFYMTF